MSYEELKRELGDVASPVNVTAVREVTLVSLVFLPPIIINK